ncbi:peptidoglycan-binding protein [Streptomyces sp. NPDC088253]|uniref:L,D-transpeptidase family protein n=1 Tax=Streptomyces sp. NPDC088253 TaxID=3365846 RepID=UPI00381523C4
MRTSTQNRRVVSTAVLSALLAVGVTATEAPTALAHPVTTTAAVSQASWPTVKAGRRGVDVTTVQLLLTAHGYATNADGVFGSRTTAKVRAFQKAKGLTPDGTVGARTWARLILTVKSGSKGAAVKAVQRQLTANGYATNADGVVGPRTVAKVKAFQKASRLTPDGIVGAGTWAALVRGGNGGSTPGGGGAVSLKFDKNPNDVTSARLYVMRGNRVVASYRAGSGVNKKVCTTGEGWLPNATYTLGLHSRTYNGRLIKGYAIRLADKRCNNNGTTGRRRTELFIHSEMTRTGGQGSGEHQKWTERNPNDFYSNGCIKLRPNDIKSMFRLLDQIGWPKSLKVVS